MSVRKWKWIPAAIFCVALAAWAWMLRARSLVEARVGEVVASEELILGLRSRVANLDESVRNHSIPDHQARGLFAGTVAAGDLVADASAKSHSADLDLIVWPVADETAQVPIDQLDLWRPLFVSTAYFQHARFTIIRGRFGEDRQQFYTDLAFSGAAQARDGTILGAEATLEIRWQRHADSLPEDADAYRIVEWRTVSFTTRSAARTLFADVLDQAIPDRSERRRARKSLHEQFIVDKYSRRPVLLPLRKYNDYFGEETAGQHPGLAIVDIDADGWDDLYVTGRWGKNQLWQNQGDGTFKEVAADYGLDIDSVCTCAAFADFDNDGDPDLFLGRSLEHSLYLVNEEGRFVDRSGENIRDRLPAMTSSIAAADYNGDGLLDVYISVYGVLSKHFLNLARPFLRAADFHELQSRTQESHRYLKRVGPPNLLLVNRGNGRFARAAEAEDTALWLTTQQSTWSDYDEDGDPDLYVANDFGPDKLLRNDGPEGFRDVTATEGHPTMRGFGMGVSFGDYDLDGRQDLYVSNMYSKAGLRITGQLPELDPGFALSANGNRLYRRKVNRFDHVSGLDPPALTVAKAGWSWGGQFVDVDNNGYPDIYVSSGYYTAPRQLENAMEM